MDTRRIQRNTQELRPRVRRHLQAARDDLEALRDTQRAYYRERDQHIEKGSFNRLPAERRLRKTYTLDGIDEAFSALEKELTAHYRREESLYPGLRSGGANRAGLEGRIEGQQREHVALMRLGTAVRRELVFVPPLKGSMSALLQHLEKQIQYEESRIFPEILGRATGEETPMPQRYRTSDDVARSLRVARPEPPEEPEPEPEKGLLSGLIGRWLKNR